MIQEGKRLRLTNAACEALQTRWMALNLTADCYPDSYIVPTGNVSVMVTRDFCKALLDQPLGVRYCCIASYFPLLSPCTVGWCGGLVTLITPPLFTQV
jgi:hypothetical protein